jgi:APA family basic amino acid/polyamine antiporter
VVGYFPFYMLAVAAVFLLRRREPGLERPFRVPGYPAVPIVFLLGATVLMIGAIADADRTAIFAFAILLAGIPVGWLWRRRAA